MKWTANILNRVRLIVFSTNRKDYEPCRDNKEFGAMHHTLQTMSLFIKSNGDYGSDEAEIILLRFAAC